MEVVRLATNIVWFVSFVRIGDGTLIFNARIIAILSHPLLDDSVEACSSFPFFLFAANDTIPVRKNGTGYVQKIALATNMLPLFALLRNRLCHFII